MPIDARQLRVLEERERRAREIYKLFTPHSGQIPFQRAILNDGVQVCMCQCGRDFGKSIGGGNTLVRAAVCWGNRYLTAIYPLKLQGKKIMWDSGYLTDQVPVQYLKGQSEELAINNTELVVKLDNKSRIQVLGADDPDALRGLKPYGVLLDEYRDQAVHVFDTMEANVIGKNGFILIISTPPDAEGPYTDVREMILAEVKKGNPRFAYMELPTWTNPMFAPGTQGHERLMGIRERLIKRGEYAFWLREYEAKFVPGGVGAVFKGYSKNQRHIERDPSWLVRTLDPNQDKLEWHCVADPSQNGTFAVLYAAVDKENGVIYILDETCVRDNAETGAADMWGRMKAKMAEHYKRRHRWECTYDEHEAWFYNDLDRHGILNDSDNLNPTNKQKRDKKEDMSLCKDLIAARGRVYISRRCENLIIQLRNYKTNKKGEYDENVPHDFIDCFRYLVAAADFRFTGEPVGDLAEQEEGQRDPMAQRTAMTGDMDDLSDDDDGTIFDSPDPMDYY